ncbi:hypothetical protein [Burkholderia guangdongensis]|uniref:hypothetical protein n=1 Tax=Burkholderia guangdongensis TaxID=1792500 RepID=UPI0015C85EF5|nr:hypothetical protein [Burkholderia guangdongensis]
MSRSFPMTLPISRFPLVALGAALVAALSLGPSGVRAQAPDAVAASVPDAASDAAAVDQNFAARQKVLDQRAAENDYRYAVAQHDCYGKFFVNHCLDNAREQMRDERTRISHEQLALDDEARAAHAQRRDEQIALKQAQDAAQAPQRAANEAANAAAYRDKQQQSALKQAQRGADAPQHAASRQAYDRKQADFQRKLDDAHQQAAQKAQERANNVERFNDKQRQATQHKADVEQRQKDAAEKAKQQQQQQGQ